jgi:deoxyribodipyrimidine photo-lyase
VRSKSKINIYWFRRDLRLHDNHGLYHALKDDFSVFPVFIFDKSILGLLEVKSDKRVEFIYNALEGMQKQLVKMGSALNVFYGFPKDVFKLLIEKYDVQKIIVNRDYEPYAIKRDQEIGALIKEAGGSFYDYKDQVIFEKNEIVKDDGKPYTVFTPYSKKWKSKLDYLFLDKFDTEKHFANFYKQSEKMLPSLEEIGFKKTDAFFPEPKVSNDIISKYGTQRDYPAVPGTSRLSVHLRFGTISIRSLVNRAKDISETFLNELIWREFYQMILWHFPKVGDGKAFKADYDFIEWRNNEEEFSKWCSGQTGYPIVDAGMRELNETGFMHNRVRMITASFLCKHLLIDWRWGEAYFAEKLLDFELASNNGGWQWVAGSGCDAAPYFRIFNPRLQTEKFDPQLKYIRKWVPEFESFTYPRPIVEHEFARKRCLEVFAEALK